MRIEVDIDGNITKHEDAQIVPYIEPDVNIITNSQLKQQLSILGLYKTADDSIMNGDNEILKIKWMHNVNFDITDKDLIEKATELGLIKEFQTLFNEASKI